MIYVTCHGCVHSAVQCEAREKFKNAVQGLGIRSIKWKCADRVSEFLVGDPVWAYTADWHFSSGEEGSPTMDHFPAIVVKLCADGGALVFIEKGAKGRESEAEFMPAGNGFCKIPFRRLLARDAAREAVCNQCDWPASKGHQQGYMCATPAGTAKRLGIDLRTAALMTEAERCAP